MCVRVDGHAELEEDLLDVRLDRGLGDEEVRCDGLFERPSARSASRSTRDPLASSAQPTEVVPKH